MTATDKKYNGWTNYETWNVALWMDNEQGSYNWGREMARDAWRAASASRTFTRQEQAQYNLGKALEEHFEENNPLNETASCYADLLGAALSEVNWHEIACHYIEEAMEDDPEEADEGEEDDDAE